MCQLAQRTHASAVLQIIAAAKKRGQEKAKLTKSMIVLDVKPWDDTTGKNSAHRCVHC